MKIPAASPLFADYDVDPRRYHEAFDGSAAIRPHWRALLADLQHAGAAQMRQRQQFVARQIRENGVTYNIYDDAKGAERPLDLDLLPHLIAADEWQSLAAGVAQRASLLDAVLGDLYGAQ
ncbi:MAG TPA: circularly permuted type 2 ATP-grasp protein, partial [Dokdonella sp.]